MARSLGWIGGSRRPAAGRASRVVSRAIIKIILSLALGFFAGALPSPAQGASPASPKSSKSSKSSAPPPNTGLQPRAKTATAPSSPKEPLAEVLRSRARAAMEANELEESRAALLALQVIDPSVGTACNLGLVARRLSLWVEAAENLNRCVRAFRAVPHAPHDIGQYDQFRAELAMARAMVAAVRVVTPKGARVTIDGAVHGTVDPEHELFLRPGPHVVEVGSDRRPIDLRAGSTKTLDFTAAPPRRPEGIDRPAWTGLISGAAFAATGGALIAMSQIYRGIADDRRVHLAQTDGRTCATSERNSASCSSLRGEKITADILLAASFVSFALSGALITDTGVLTGGKKPPPARVVVGLGGVRVEGSW